MPGFSFSRRVSASRSAELGGLVHLEARRSDWAILFDSIGMSLGRPVRNLDADLNFVVLEAGLGYGVTETVELIAGGRFVSMEAEIARIVDPILTVSGRQSWGDPFVGSRFRAPLSEKWGFTGRGDIGGFGIGSDLTWILSATLDYRVSDRASLVFGYRAWDVDYETGSGTDRFKCDILTSGPGLGFTFHF